MIRLGSIIAWLMVIFAGLRIGIGYYIAFTTTTLEEAEALSRRYLATPDTVGAINQGFYVLVAGVVIGLLVRIARR